MAHPKKADYRSRQPPKSAFSPNYLYVFLLQNYKHNTPSLMKEATKLAGKSSVLTKIGGFIPVDRPDYGTPMRDDAFEKTDSEKIEDIAVHFREIMNILGLDLTDDSLNGTPRRVAKMYVNEIFSGLSPANKPAITLFDNKYRYRQMLLERGIKV